MANKISLRETSLEGRCDNIERCSIGDEVSLNLSKTKENPLRLEVFCNNKSIGTLPSDISDNIAPLIAINLLNYNAKIVELIPLSKRNIHAKSAIVAIKIKV